MQSANYLQIATDCTSVIKCMNEYDAARKKIRETLSTNLTSILMDKCSRYEQTAPGYIKQYNDIMLVNPVDICYTYNEPYTRFETAHLNYVALEDNGVICKDLVRNYSIKFEDLDYDLQLRIYSDIILKVKPLGYEEALELIQPELALVG